MADLDSILSGESARAPEPKTVVETPSSQPDIMAGNHDHDVTEAQQQPEPQGEAAEGDGQKMVPHEALHAERQKVKRYTEQVADFQRQLTEQNAAWEARMTKLLETVKPQAAAEPKPQPVIWEDPDAYTDARVSERLTPIQKELAETRFTLSKVQAITSFGAETVTAAETAMMEAIKAGQLNGDAVKQQITQSRDPVGDVVRWYKNSPAVKDAELRAQIRAELEAELKGGQPAQPSVSTPVMPSNLAGARNVGTRSGPQWSGPQTLNDIFDRRSAKG